MNRRSHRLTFCLALIVAAALALSACVPSEGSSVIRASTTSTPTDSVEASSLCSSTANFIQQSMDGRITGCFRVPDNVGQSLVVSLQAYLENSGTISKGPTTSLASSPHGNLTLTLSSPATRPGATVTIIGRYTSGSLATKNSFADLCWDGCRTGLVEQGVSLHWTGPRSFRAALTVPSTAWLEIDRGGVTIQPLVSGTYDVAIECVQLTSGCALGPAAAQTTIKLVAPSPRRCVKGRPCETLHLSASRSAPGDEVIVHGWAPLESIIGQPFGFDLSIAGSHAKSYPPFSSSRISKTDGFSVALSPKILTLTPDKTWASLGRLTSLSSNWAGPSSISPVPASSEIAWCSSTGPVLSIGSTSTPLRTSSVATTLRGSGLSLLPGAASTPRCATILVAPRHHASVFVGFDAAMGGSIPPVYMAGLYTSNDGDSWRRVPTPTGFTPQDFSGFETNGTQVVAIYFDANQNDDGFGSQWPLGSNHGVIETEVTSDGGTSWKSSMLNCPSVGPCAAFGPYYLGNCAMDGSNQSIMSGAPGSATGQWDKWFNTSWDSTLNGCFSQQLVTTSAHGLVLVDPSSQFELLQSSDSGQTWSNRSIPPIPGQTNPLPLGDVLLLAPTGDLLAEVTSPSSTYDELFRLAPGSTSWCQVPNVFDATKGAWFVGSVRVDGRDLLWSQVRSTNGANPPSQLHVLALSKIKC